MVHWESFIYRYYDTPLRTTVLLGLVWFGFGTARNGLERVPFSSTDCLWFEQLKKGPIASLYNPTCNAT
jgi:hypothetical protein